MSISFHGKVEQGGLAVGSIVCSVAIRPYFGFVEPDISAVLIIQGCLDQMPVGIVTSGICRAGVEPAIKVGHVTGVIGQGSKTPVGGML